jgi:hypothetical protein
MDLAPLLCIVRTTEMPLLFLIQGLLLVISVVSAASAIFAISLISCADFLIVLLLLRGPLAARLKESSPSLGRLNAYISNCK